MDDEKAYTIEIIDRDEFLHVIVGGARVTPEIALEYWREVVDACDTKNCSKILLEHNFNEMIAMGEMLTIIGPVGEMLKGRRMAFYDSHGNNEIPEAGKAILRGHDVAMRIFHDLETAEKWLVAN